MGLRSQVVARKKQIQESARSRAKAKKFSLSRNLRDAYFHAVTFAAFANDKGQPEMLDDEKTALLGIGHDLGVGECESARIFSHVLSLVGSGHYNALLKDCLSQFDGVATYKKFLADFDVVFNLGNGATAKELEGWHDDFLQWLPEAVSSEYTSEKERIAAEEKVKAAAARKHKKACAKAGMNKRFRNALDIVEADYGEYTKTTAERITEIGRRMDGIDPDVVDMGDELLAIYERMERRRVFGLRKDIAIMWRVIAMLVLKHGAKYVNAHSYEPTLDQLLRQCSGFHLPETLRKFYENYFDKEIEFEE